MRNMHQELPGDIVGDGSGVVNKYKPQINADERRFSDLF